jgi:hypothetical protein
MISTIWLSDILCPWLKFQMSHKTQARDWFDWAHSNKAFLLDIVSLLSLC